MEQGPTQASVHEWPQLVGQTYEKAARVIKEGHPELTVLKVPEGSMVTFDYRPDRVRVFVNEDDQVVTVPRTG